MAHAVFDRSLRTVARPLWFLWTDHPDGCAFLPDFPDRGMIVPGAVDRTFTIRTAWDPLLEPSRYLQPPGHLARTHVMRVRKEERCTIMNVYYVS